jgi:hypothetical protein
VKTKKKERGVPPAAQTQIRGGPVAALLLLLGLVFSSAAGVASRVDSDSNASRLAQPKTLKATAGLRSGARDAAPDDDERLTPKSALPPASPEPLRWLVSLRSASNGWAAAAWTGQGSSSAYHARAPPAA